MDTSVFIYCGGKCGSSTLETTCKVLRYKTLHLHSNFQYNSYYHNIVNKTGISDISELILKSTAPRKYVIDSYRNPFERLVSSIFQNLNSHLMRDNLECNIKSINICIVNNYKIETSHPLDDELPILRDVIFKEKYITKTVDNITYIKLRFSDIENWSDYLSEIFGFSVKIFSSNLSSRKQYYELYKEFNKNFYITQEMFDFFTEEYTFKKYNSIEEQNEYKIYWSSRIKPNDYFI